jgi:hypothetical protein
MHISSAVRWFIKSGVIMLMAGAALGAVMHQAQDRALIAAHAHITLAGGLMAIIYALCYQQFPRMARTRLTRVHLVLHLGAGGILLALLVFFGISGRTFDDALPHAMAGTIVVASLMFLASIAAFAGNVFLSIQSHALDGATTRIDDAVDAG